MATLQDHKLQKIRLKAFDTALLWIIMEKFI